MSGFRGTAGGATARFTATEAAIIRTMVSQIADLVQADPGPPDLTGGVPPAGGEPAGAQGPGSPDDLAEILSRLERPATPPDDPVLARLFPDAYSEDPAAAGEFRRYTEDGLRTAKVENARLVLASLPEGGGRVRLSREEAQRWLQALNDVRLALGVRLEITEDFEDQLAGLSASDPRAAYFEVYNWLTYVQETLVRALW
jgi:hypothetical protein